MTTLKDRIAIAVITTVISTVVFQLIWPEDGLLVNFLFAAGISTLYQVVGWSIDHITR